MQSRYAPLVILSILLCALAACSPSPDARRIARAEAIMDDRPDSALDILDSIDPAGLGDDLRALHAVLLLRAKEICNIDISDDSVMPWVIDHYVRTGDRQREMLARYHHAVAMSQRQDYAQSIISATKAYDLAAADSNHFWCGMTSRLISDAYHETDNSAEELAYARRGRHHFQTSGRQPYINYALLDHARALVSHSDYDEAIAVGYQTIDSARIYGDVNLECGAYQLLGLTFLSQKKPQEAIKAYLAIRNLDGLEPDDYAYLGLAYAFDGQIKPAKVIYDSISTSDIKRRQDLLIWLQFEISKSSGDYYTAMNTAKDLDSMSNANYERVITQNITGTLIASYEAEKQIQMAKAEALESRTFLIGLLMVLGGIVVCASAWHIYHRQKLKTAKNLLIARRIEDELDKAKRSNKAIIALKYDMLDKFCQLMYQVGDDEKSQGVISKAVIVMLNEWRTKEKKKFAELTSIINKSYNNIYDDFLADFPDLADADYKIFVFSILGFSGSTIAWFLKSAAVTSVYDRKKRLKNRIKTSDIPNRDRYLEVL